MKRPSRVSALAFFFVACFGQVGPVVPHPSKSIFPHFAFGGAWETELVLVNTSSISPAVVVTVSFFDQAGRPAMVRATKTLGDGAPLAAGLVSAFNVPIWGGGVTRILLADPDGPTRVGWARIGYSSASYDGPIISGQVIFRQRVDGRPDFEAAVPLSSAQDWIFVLPYDNRDGFVTSVAMVNSGTKAIKARVGLLRFNGAAAARGLNPIDLAPGQQLAFSLPDLFPATANEAGVMLVQTDPPASTLSAFGLRFSPGGAFTSLPVMNRFEMNQTHPEVP